ncbi:MAG: metal-dependent transcriptional regulator [Candidatus Hermodarchaeota archaeon]
MLEEIKESYEDYLKAILKISKRKKGGWVSNSEIAEFLKVKPSSVTNMLYKLKSQGFVSWQPRKMVRLTLNGKEIANKVLIYSKQLKLFFKNVLMIKSEKEISELCCLIEHHITPEVYLALEDLNSSFL